MTRGSHARSLLRRTVVAGGLVLVAGATQAAAISDLSGKPIPNTSTASMTAQVTGGPVIDTKLGVPFAGGPLAGVSSPATPEQDLLDALTAIETAPDTPTAEAARTKAVAILRGAPVPGAIYSGIPLINAFDAAKTKTVPPGGTVTVTTVRWGEHQITDTARLNFQSPTQPYSITYRIAEIGGAEGGELTPTPLLADGGTPVGGMHSAVVPLGLDETDLGSTQSSRFTLYRSSLPGGPAALQPEHTRMALQTVTVAMPPPQNTVAVLNPNLRPGHEADSLLRAPSSADVTPTEGQLAATAPEIQLAGGLDALNTANLAAAHAWATTAKPLVAMMRVKSHLPPGVAPDPAADVTVAFINDEIYVERRSVRVPPGAQLKVRVRNEDGFTHTVSATALAKLSPVFGAINWGRFDWSRPGADLSVTPGSSALLTLTLPSDAFELVLSDPTSGDQAVAHIDVDRGPVQESVQVPGPAFTAPLHQTIAPDGSIWITLTGGDAIGHLVPTAHLDANGDGAPDNYQEFKLPPPCGTAPFGTVGLDCAPFDLEFDAHGILWVTLSQQNLLARIDPAVASPGSPCTNADGSDCPGVKLIKLDDCTAGECRLPPPPVPPGVNVTRLPTQMTVMSDPQGNTDIWFTEMLADGIGRVKVAANPTVAAGSAFIQPIGQMHMPCGCKVQGFGAAGGTVFAGNPGGIAHLEDGTVWFTEANANRIGRITPSATAPFQVTAQTLRHFKIPGGVSVTDPDLGGTFITSFPHSITTDPFGRLWFTELATNHVGYLDSVLAVPDTTAGMMEIDLGTNDFGSATQPADLISDPDGNIFVTEEYGDHIGVVRPNCKIRSYRPTRRLSLTDQPVVDAQGNLWFLEVGANLITRISGVAATSHTTPRESFCGPPSPTAPGTPNPQPDPTPNPTPAGTGGSSPIGGVTGGSQTVTTPPTGGPTAPVLAPGCKRRQWLTGSLAKPDLLLVGATTTEVTACIGTPTRRAGAVWSYGSGLRLTITGGRVKIVDIRSGWRSPTGLGVGSPAPKLARLGGARFTSSARGTRRTATVTTARGARVRVQLTTAGGRVTRIMITSLGNG